MPKSYDLDQIIVIYSDMYLIWVRVMCIVFFFFFFFFFLGVSFGKNPKLYKYFDKYAPKKI